MYDELTRQDLQKMQEEIDYRVQVLRPRLIEDVQTARAFGDLSEIGRQAPPPRRPRRGYVFRRENGTRFAPLVRSPGRFPRGACRRRAHRRRECTAGRKAGA